MTRDVFSILGLTATRIFMTESSVGYELTRVSKELTHIAAIHDRVTELTGWLDVHYPCHDHIEAQLRISIPPEFHNYDAINTIRLKVFDHLGIPGDATWELCAYESDESGPSFSMDQPINREGLTDRS